MDDAVNSCERAGEECTLYALGNTVVGEMTPAELAAAAKKYYLTVSPAMAVMTEDQLVGVLLSSKEITAHISERTVLGRNYNGLEYRGVWRANGSITAAATSVGINEWVRTDEGTWSTESGKLCRQWQHWSGGRRECLSVTKDGDTLRAYDTHGDVLELIVLLNQE